MATERKTELDGGRGRPSRTRFKPGRSGKPRGRPRGSQNHASPWFELLNEEVPFGNGSMTRMEMFVRDLVDEAVAGKRKAVVCVERLMWEYDKDQPEFEVEARARMRAAGIAELKRPDEEFIASVRKRYAEPEKEKKAENRMAGVGKASEAGPDAKAGDHKVGDAKAPDEKVAAERAKTEQKDADENKTNSNDQNRTADVGKAPEASPDAKAGEHKVGVANASDEKGAGERANTEQKDDGAKKTNSQTNGADGKAVGSPATGQQSRLQDANGGASRRTTTGRFLG